VSGFRKVAQVQKARREALYAAIASLLPVDSVKSH